MKNIQSVDELKEFLPSDYKIRVRIFEHSFEAVMNPNVQASIGEQIMFDKYKNQVYMAVEPIEEINALIKHQERPAKGRKAGIGKGGKVKIEDRNLHTQVKASRLLTDKDADVIYLHMMIPVDVAPKVAMADFSKAEGYIRVYKTKEGRWRQCNKTEYEVYQRMIMKYRSSAFNYLESRFYNLGVYALKIDDLVVMKTVNENGIWNKGKQCNNYKSSEKQAIVQRVREYYMHTYGSELMQFDIRNCKDLIQFLGDAGLIFDDKFDDNMVNLSSPEEYADMEMRKQRAMQVASATPAASAANAESVSLANYVEEGYSGFGNFL